MDEKRNLIIFLSQFDLTSTRIYKVLDFLAEGWTIEDFKKCKFPKDILSPSQQEEMKALANENLVKNYVDGLLARGIKITTIADDDFPSKLKGLNDSPCILYYMGDLSLASKPAVAIVGTRKPTSYGRMVTERLASDLAKEGIVIISGLAYGVDSISHRACLECGGKTVAVLGSGFDHIYPAEHMALAKEIAERGLLISEFRPKKQANTYTFPIRNRIIAGLSDGVLITEAGFKSGTIHTKEYALEYGRNLYALPGNIDCAMAELPNDIIRSGQGQCVVTANDIICDFKGQISFKIEEKTQNGTSKTEILGLSEDENAIVEILKNGMLSLDELAQNVKISAKNINTCLTTLEIRGIIKRLPAGMICLA